MIKEFRLGLKYVFTMKKYVKTGENKHCLWAKEANGREVDIDTRMTTNGYSVVPEWCKCIGSDRGKKN